MQIYIICSPSFFIGILGIITNAYLVIAKWLFFRLLKINHDKTQVLLVEFPDVVARCKAFVLYLNLGGSVIAHTKCVKNLALLLTFLSFKDCIQFVWKPLILFLYNIKLLAFIFPEAVLK